MNLLALDTSTESMSIAVQRGDGAGAHLWQHTAAGGALTSTHLIPEIQRLMGLAALDFGQLDAVVFGAGPGSFTGLRTACSVAQGLAFGAALPVLPVDTLLAVAEQARSQLQATDNLAVTALLDARMDELYAASYQWAHGRWSQSTDYRLIKPEQLAWDGVGVLAGNVFAAYGARLPDGPGRRVPAWPTAAALLRLAPALLAAGAAVSAAQALPTYIRDKVAQTTAERAALKPAGPTA
ncbi:tRNA (adenosine(37)-N6)-threonylcarbamoyltransferase complex dimerization subunit type 1 TsaB [Rhodoferax sp.]|uniref:tRNA (adenosine(37)-N6)-threonylcarbamoyltransferase complex dimerization subunit type 1 TsaB n=1 Tax=Rhodoferax sp. TaxID=50421 RepID=UPI0026254680|nr:tRNA (adenosine(37)-N6)-threonylcarbamoyltransferase complex dimerization subunit type 1 TsaB [Rhodoferax sp.]MDD2925294.1 tRNA (adenosine(37)-N6)-threonylcarbamoyltransferase complex dimerization subunit type 1 TsaB [Rhodoferax sp.]